MSILGYIIIFSIIGGVFSLIGGLTLLWKEQLAKKISLYLISFAAGTLIGAAFLDLLPEAVEETGKINVIIFALLGFLFFFLLENLCFKVHHHVAHYSDNNHDKNHHPLNVAPNLVLIGDSIHNFLDGVAITAAFLVNIPLGITTALVVAAHEIPQEISDFAIMIHAAWKRKKIIFWNLVSALMTMVGALITFGMRATIEPYIGYLLAITAGLFIYISATDLLPEIEHEASRRRLFINASVFLLGVLIIWLATILVHR